MAAHSDQYYWSLPSAQNNFNFLTTAEASLSQTPPTTPRDRFIDPANTQLSWAESGGIGATPRVLRHLFWNTDGIGNNLITPGPLFPYGDDPFLDTPPLLSTPHFHSPGLTEPWDSQIDQSPSSTLAPDTPTYQPKPDTKSFWNHASGHITGLNPFAFVVSSITSGKSSAGGVNEFESTSSPPTSGPSGAGLGSGYSNASAPKSDSSAPQSPPQPSSTRQSRSQTPYSVSRSTRTRKGRSSPHRSLSGTHKHPRRRPKKTFIDSTWESSPSDGSRRPSIISSDCDYPSSPLPSLVIKLPVEPVLLERLNYTGRLFPLPIHFVEAKLDIPKPETCTYPRAVKPPWRDPSYQEVSEANMAPSYRASNRRQNRAGYNDHDVFDGLPVRHWRREMTTVVPPPDQDSTKPQNDIWAVELPHGMPKDSHLLQQHSQDLLRAARSGKIWKRPAPTEEEEIDPEVSEKQEKKEDDGKDKAFSARAWKQIPRNQEGPDIEYLAKRRKGLITYTKPLPVVPTVTKTIVRKTDAAGNEYNQELIVPNGQQVDGEVISRVVIPDPNLVPQVAPMATPPKRKTPVAKKKIKAVRGRKKKIVPPPNAPAIVPANGAIPSGAPILEAVGPAVKAEIDAAATPTTGEDTVMGEGSVAASDDEEGDEDGDEGDDDDESVGEQQSPSKVPRTTESPTPVSLPTMKTIPDIAPLNFLPSGIMLPPHLEREKSDGKSGSPLKNVALSTSAVATPLTSPTVSGPPQTFPDVSSFEGVPAQPHEVPEPEKEEEVVTINDAMDIDTDEIISTSLPPPPPNPTTLEVQASELVRREEEEEEEMLLDIVENANNVQIGQAQPLPIAVPEVAAQIDMMILEEPVPPVTVSEQPTMQDPVVAVEQANLIEQVSEPEKIATPVEKAPTPVEVPSELPVEPTSPPKIPEVAEPEISHEKKEDIPEALPQELPQDLPPKPEAVPEEEEALPDTQPLPHAEILPDPQDDIKHIKDDIEDDSDGFPDLLGGLEKSLGQPPPAKVDEPVEIVQEVVAPIINNEEEKAEEKAEAKAEATAEAEAVDPSAGSS